MGPVESIRREQHLPCPGAKDTLDPRPTRNWWLQWITNHHVKLNCDSLQNDCHLQLDVYGSQDSSWILYFVFWVRERNVRLEWTAVWLRLRGLGESLRLQEAAPTLTVPPPPQWDCGWPFCALRWQQSMLHQHRHRKLKMMSILNSFIFKWSADQHLKLSSTVPEFWN